MMAVLLKALPVAAHPKASHVIPLELVRGLDVAWLLLCSCSPEIMWVLLAVALVGLMVVVAVVVALKVAALLGLVLRRFIPRVIWRR